MIVQNSSNTSAAETPNNDLLLDTESESELQTASQEIEATLKQYWTV